MRYFIVIFLTLTLWSCGTNNERLDALVNENPNFDLAILNGTVVDGSGDARYEADLLVRNGKIVYIGEVEASQINAKQTLDAEGKIVSPGFIDVHAHGNPLSGTSFENFVANGVTTIFLGQDGYHPSLKGQPYDLPAWMDSLETAGLQLNVAMLAGHGSIRRQAGITDLEAPSEAQIEQMVELLNASLNAGAYGLSTGLEYVPGMYASKQELSALANVLGGQGTIMASHMRNEDDEAIAASLQELIDLGKFCKVHASHLKVVYGKGKERGQEILKIIEATRNRGIEISADVYPYMASYTGIGIVFPKWAKTQAQFEEAMKTRESELEDFLQQRVMKRNGPDATLFGSGPYAGKTLAKAADDEGISFVELLMKIGPQGASGAYFIMDQELQDEFIVDQHVMIASDGSPTMLHPRGHGTQARIIEKYVNEERLSLEEAISKMAGIPATTFGLNSRGFIREGYKADLVIFDPAKVHETATYANPYQLSEGFEQVIINGNLARSQQALSENSVGRLLRKGLLK